MRLSLDQAQNLAHDASLLGADGRKIGRIADIYIDADTRTPEWAVVHTGLFGGRESLVPLAEATLQDSDVVVPYLKDQIKGAPTVDADGELSQEEERQLYAHYGLSYSESASDSGLPTAGTAAPATAAAPVAPVATPSTGDDYMTRSEERLQVGVVRQPSQSVRLRKRIVQENVSTTVPVTAERAVVTREPITESNRDAALAGPDLSEEEHEVVLTRERPVVKKETVPVERVRLAKDAIVEEVEVNETLRKEQIDLSDTVSGDTVSGGTSSTGRQQR